MATYFTDDNSLIPSARLPLYGRRIILTAPRTYACRLAQQIIARGGFPILMSAIETCLLDRYTQLDAALEKIEEFDWIAFTSRNGIEAVFQRLQELGIHRSAIARCKLCAIGKDAERLLFFCDRVDLIPAASSTDGIVAELAQISGIENQRILVPVPDVVGISEPDVVPKFILNLQNLGMKVTRLPAYQTRCLDKGIYEVELNLIREGKIDAIAFSSTGEITSFLQMVEGQPEWRQCAIACFGPITAANAKRLGIEVAICGTDYSSFAGFAEAIAAYFARH